MASVGQTYGKPYGTGMSDAAISGSGGFARVGMPLVGAGLKRHTLDDLAEQEL